jgi:hypothetical protein
VQRPEDPQLSTASATSYRRVVPTQVKVERPMDERP